MADAAMPRARHETAGGNASASVYRVIDSGALFAGARELRIVHAGQPYCLRITRQNKLILTK